MGQQFLTDYLYIAAFTIFGLGGTAKNVLKIKPPLIITAQETDTVLELFRSSLTAALG